ncbi:hypothetical protein [Saccharicrinis aurantiacus]|uniref:hypothetical protein n=1 Tax=Saccharicrinis aurantiacus TaxID=1849719 RepID=UPI00094F4D0D|nr:hypothetical protein [Saccharicrinis aurantiacus]
MTNYTEKLLLGNFYHIYNRGINSCKLFGTQSNYVYSNAIGGVKLDVRKKDLIAATLILKEGGYIQDSKEVRQRKVEIIELKDNTDISTCPFCESDNVYKKKEINPLMILLYFLMGAFFPILSVIILVMTVKKNGNI